MDYRIEKDTLGEVQVPKDKYWGAQTERSRNNFKIGPEASMPHEIIEAFAYLKKAAAYANFDLANAEPSAGVFGIDWWMDANATIPVKEPGSVPAGTYYGTYQGVSVKCPTPMKVSYYTAKDPEFALCESNFISNPLVRQLMQNAADATEKRDQFISR